MLLENQLWRNGRDQTTTVRYPETTPFQRQTPNLFISNSREHGYTVGEIMAGIFHSQISFNEHASLKKKQRRKEKGNMEKNHIYYFARPSMSECFQAHTQGELHQVTRSSPTSEVPGALEITDMNTRHKACFRSCVQLALLN